MEKLISRSILIFSLLIWGSFFITAQVPTHYPTSDEPVKLNLVNIIIYFVIPLLLLVFYIYWLRSKRKKKEKEKKEKDL